MEYASDPSNDPINDPEFMAFLSSYPSSLPNLSSLTPQPTETLSSTLPTSKNKSTNIVKKTNSLPNKIGRCEHPKHIIYRQEKYILLASTATPDEKLVMKAIPRRGRPPKGSKSTEIEAISPVNYPIVELTVRPLPKRLEKVVGKSNIKVCLTCLKRSDTDPDYITDIKYVGPQKK
ncbi:hypothetical protein BD770DRAFT_332739 [Pilaira anomala]|nr:hypothetical protein BD770DRAFT_332739 [Pilaira anomala]